MGIVQLEQILQRDDVPSDVKQTVMDHLDEFKRNKETLRESAESPRIFWDSSPDHLVLLDSALNVIDANKAGLKTFGITHEELIGRNILDFEPTLKGTDRYRKYLEVLQTGKPFFIKDLTPHPKFGDLRLFVRVFKVGDGLGFITTDITKFKLAEQKLKESEEKLRIFMDSVPDSITLYDSNFNFIDINKVALENLGSSFTKEHIIGKNVLEILPHLKDTERYNTYKEVMKTGKPFFHVTLIPWKLEERHFSVRAFKVGDGLGVLATDVTELKRAEAKTRVSEERFSRIFEDCPIGISIIGRNLQIIMANQAHYNMLGYSERELKSLKVEDITYPDDHEIEKSLTEQLIQGKIINFKLEKRFIRKDRQVIWGNLTASATYDEEGKFLFGLGMIEDISKRKQIEMELNLEKEITESLINNIPSIALLIKSETRQIVASNKFGVGFGAVPGKSCYETWGQQQEPCPWCLAPKAWKTGEEQHLVVENQNRVWDAHWIPIKDDSYLFYAFDITELKQAEMVRKELEERREKFIWMTSHELRTPLTVITGYFDFLEKNITGLAPNRQDKIFSTIKSNLRRLELLIDEVSLIAQFEQKIFRIEKSAFDLGKFFQEAKEEYQILLGEQLEFSALQLEFPLIIEGDLNRLRQVLDNVVNNAIRQTHPEHRLIKLSLTVSPSIIRIICTDNGAGIAPDNLERIFDQFLSIETDYATAGTGIGLFLSRKIMEALGGSLTAQSQGIGHGATFIVELPNIHPE